MANTITKTTLIDGARNLAVHVHIAGDGSGEQTNTVLIDRSAYEPVAGTALRLKRIHGMLSGFSARLAFDADTDLVLAQLPDGDLFDYCWEAFGGVSSGHAGAGANGDILLSTASLGNGDRGTFILEMTKD